MSPWFEQNESAAENEQLKSSRQKDTDSVNKLYFGGDELK